MALLETRGLVARYGDFQALYGIDTELDEGETIAVIGANGAGKSTYLHSIVGLHPGGGDAVRLDGRSIGHLPPSEIIGLGVALVPEGRRLFTSLSVEENLLIGAYGRQAARILDPGNRVRAVPGAGGTASISGQPVVGRASSKWWRSAAR